MKNKTSTTLFLAAGLLLLAGMIAPIALADEGVWGAELTNPSFLYRLGPEVQISTTSTPLDAHRHLPAVVHNWNHKEYLVVWHNEWPGGGRDIYAQRVSENGTKIGSWFCITTGAKDRIQPALAYSATDDEYLVVWMQEDDTRPGVYNIRGRIIAWNGGYMRPEFTIITWTDRTFWTPRVAWNSIHNEYMVVWNAFDTSGGLPGTPRDITGARVTNQDGGKVIDTNMLAFPSDGGPHQVDIAYNVARDEYLIVCVIVHTEASSGNDIYGRRVAANGSPLTWIEIYKDDFDGGRKHQNAPAVATNEQDKYMVVWEHQYSTTDHDIFARKYNADGNPDGNSFTISSWTQDDTVPAIAANGSSKEWLTVWQRAISGGAGGYSIHGWRWGWDGGVPSYYLDVVDWTFYECTAPAVAADIPGYLIVYEELPPPGKASAARTTNYQHIYGRMWWPEAAYLPLALRNKS